MDYEYITKRSKRIAKKYENLNPSSFYEKIAECIKHYDIYSLENLDPMNNCSISLRGFQFQELYCRGDDSSVKKIFYKLLKLSLKDPDPQIRKQNKDNIEHCINNINGGDYNHFEREFPNLKIKTKSKFFESLRISVSGYGPSLYRIVFFLEPKENYKYIYWKIINQKNSFVFYLQKNRKYLLKYYKNNFIKIYFYILSFLIHNEKIGKKLNKKILKIILFKFHIKSKYTKKTILFFYYHITNFSNKIIILCKLHRTKILKKHISNNKICNNLFQLYYDSTSYHKKEHLKKFEKKLYYDGNKYLGKRFKGIIYTLKNELPCTMITSFSLQHYYIPVGHYHISCIEHETTQIVTCITSSDSKHTNYIDYKNAQLFAPISDKKHDFASMYMKHIRNIEVFSTPNTEELSSICIEYQILKIYYEELIKIRNLYYYFDFNQLGKMHIIRKILNNNKFLKSKKNLYITEAIVDFIKSENRNSDKPYSYGRNPFQTQYIYEYDLSNGEKRQNEYFETYKNRIKYLLKEIMNLMKVNKQIFKERNDDKNIEINNKIQKTILVFTFISILIALIPYREKIKKECNNIITKTKQFFSVKQEKEFIFWEEVVDN